MNTFLKDYVGVNLSNAFSVVIRDDYEREASPTTGVRPGAVAESSRAKIGARARASSASS